MSSAKATRTIGSEAPFETGSQEGAANRAMGLLQALWRSRLTGLGVAVAIAAVAGLVSAWLTPRGPLTPLQVAVTVVGLLLVGITCGLVSGTRWAMPASLAAYLAVFELARIGSQGATVDAIHLTSTYGIFALVAGRLAHGLIVLPPLLLGIGAGIWLAHRWGHPTAPSPRRAGRILTALTAVAVLLLTVALIKPGTTAPILGPDGNPAPDSIAELVTVEIGGVDQVLMIRGRSIHAPVLLHLAGGPGGTDLGAMRADARLESDVVVATWDQRGTGKSYATSIDPVDDLTLDQAVADTLAVTEYLRERFAQDKIYLSANSWGSIPGVLAVQQQPALFHAYVGTGQMVNNRATDQMFYDDALAWAEATGNDGLAQQIRAAGPPPYENLLDYEYTVSYEHRWNAYPGVDQLWEMPFNTFVPENSLLDRINALRGMFDVNYFVYPQLQDHDFRSDVPRLDVPVHLVLGAHEARGRAVLAEDWFEQLQAPAKELIIFDRSGHRPSFEQPAEFASLMRRIVGDTTGN
jgi:proline iminopeptidase